MENLSIGCKSQESAAGTPPHFVGVYWTHFWNRQRYTRTHLFRDYPERGYANVSPEEGRSLCGESIPSYYRETTPQGRDVCKRCKAAARKLGADL